MKTVKKYSQSRDTRKIKKHLATARQMAEAQLKMMGFVIDPFAKHELTFISSAHPDIWFRLLQGHHVLWLYALRSRTNRSGKKPIYSLMTCSELNKSQIAMALRDAINKISCEFIPF